MTYNNCLHCGQEFEAKRSDKKYCSDSCKQQAYKIRKNADASERTNENTSKPNPAVFSFLKDYLKGFLSEKGHEELTDSVANIEQVRVSKSGMFIIESLAKEDINKINQRFFDGEGNIYDGRTKPINVEKLLNWDWRGSGDALVQTFETFKIMIPYDLVRQEFREYTDDDLIIE